MRYLDPRKKNTDINESKIKWNTEFNINTFLETDLPENAFAVLENMDKDLMKNKITKLINNEMNMNRSLTILPLLPSAWHPLEYGSWSLKNMVNSLVLMNYLKKTETESLSHDVALHFRVRHYGQANLIWTRYF